MNDVPEAGAEAGGVAEAANDAVETTEQLLEAQRQADGSFAVEGAEGAPVDGAEAGKEGEEGKVPEAPKPPLTLEELQTRHENLNKALAAERGEKRALKAQLAEMATRIEAVEKGPSPEAQTLQSLDVAIGEWGQVDWVAFAKADPAGHAEARATYDALLEERGRVAHAERVAAQKAQAGTFQQKVTALVDDLHTQEAEFKADKPDYDDAVAFLKKAAAEDLNRKGIFDEAAIERQVAEEWLVIGARLKQQGKNAAEFCYEEAKRRGYTPKGADITALQAGSAAVSPLGGVAGRPSNEGASFEEKVESLSGAALDSYLDKILRNRAA